MGHDISREGIEIDPKKKVNKITTAATPTTVKQLHSWLILAKYYCLFIQNFAAETFVLCKLLLECKSSH